MSPPRALAVFVIVGAAVLAAATGSAQGQEWHEAYRDGVKALAQGQPERAVSLLEYAVSLRPQPGRDIVTYGTNVQHEYYPYLRLLQAYVQLKDLPGARSALKRSETWGREPAEERRRLAGLVDDLAARLAPPPPVAPPTTVAAAPVALPSAPPVTVPATPPAAPAPSPSVAATAPRAAAPAATPNAVPPRPRASPEPPPISTGSLEVVSQPPGAAVYLDDELIGTTDPEWGRLVRSAVAPGRHRIRVQLPGHQDLAEDVEVRAGARTELRRRLVASTAPAAEARPAIDTRLVAYGVVAVLLLVLTAWALRRSPAAIPKAVPTPGRPAPTPRSGGFDASAPTPPRGTPPGLGSPGVHRGPDGLEYFGDYRLVAPLGRGGMASVYRAERGTEVCALKRPLAAFLEEPEFLERFMREAEIGRTLHHPNIVRILERGEVEGVPYFTMELVPGETLQAGLQRTRGLEPRPATAIVVQIAEALDYAHLKGVVHRDLKPSNVMVLADGTAKVMDYGIARARRFEGLTVTGAFLGSPEYVAPETIEGKGTDGRSDLYALGVVFYEALTGARPFVGETPFTILRKHLTEVPKAPSTVRPGVPAELDRIVGRLLSKTPEGRYAAAEDLVLELRQFLHHAA